MRLKRIAIVVGSTAAVALGASALPASADTAGTAGGNYFPVLRQGQTNENVRSLQWLLNCQGYSVTAPSHFGPTTVKRVKAFQSAHAEYPDGNVGAKTWTALVYRGQVSYGTRNDCVKALQVQLNKYRSLTHQADLPISGYYGPKTRAAFKAYQTYYRHPATTVVSAADWSHLLTDDTNE